jgi:hypothetical protein
MRNLIV